MFDRFLRDTTFAARSLLRSRGVTSVAIASLAVGIAANATIFSLVQAVEFPSLIYPEASRIVFLESRNHQRGLIGMPVSAPDALDIVAATRHFGSSKPDRRSDVHPATGRECQAGNGPASDAEFLRGHARAPKSRTRAGCERWPGCDRSERWPLAQRTRRRSGDRWTAHSPRRRHRHRRRRHAAEVRCRCGFLGAALPIPRRLRAGRPAVHAFRTARPAGDAGRGLEGTERHQQPARGRPTRDEQGLGHVPNRPDPHARSRLAWRIHPVAGSRGLRAPDCLRQHRQHPARAGVDTSP